MNTAIHEENRLASESLILRVGEKERLSDRLIEEPSTRLVVEYNLPLGQLISRAGCEMAHYNGDPIIKPESLYSPREIMEVKKFRVVQFTHWGFATPANISREFSEAGLRPAEMIELLTFTSRVGTFSTHYHPLHALGSCHLRTEVRNVPYRVMLFIVRKTKTPFTVTYCPQVERSGKRNILRIDSIPDFDSGWQPDNLFLGIEE